jgi:hypothetical protein
LSPRRLQIQNTKVRKMLSIYQPVVMAFW